MPVKLEITEDQKHYMIFLRESGHSYREIGEIVGFKEKSVHKYLTIWGYNNGRGYKFTEEDKLQIITWYGAGYSCKYIADLYGYSENVIRNALIKWGIDTSKGMKFSDEDKDNIIMLWYQGYFIHQISDIFGVSKSVIRKYLNIWGIDTSKRDGFSIEDRVDIEHMYIDDEYSCETIAKIYNVTSGTIWLRLKAWGIDPRNPVRHHVNHNFFSSITSEFIAYWLGFISADGCVYKNTINIALHPGDELHLHKFINCVDSDYPVGVYDRFVQVHITSIDMVNDLAKYGVVSRKSLILKPYLKIPQHLIRHYWRGFVDGDGSLYITNNLPGVNLVGTFDVCNGFKNWCSNYISSKASVCKHSSIFGYNLCGSKAIPIIEELYRDCNIYLDRKYDRAMDYLNKWG